jgi:hypothetical protein
LVHELERGRDLGEWFSRLTSAVIECRAKREAVVERFGNKANLGENEKPEDAD